MADLGWNIKKASDKTIGYLNKGTRYLLEVLDVQNKNLFELVLWPEFSPTANPVTTLAQGALDSAIARIYVQSITVPFLKFEYESYQEYKEIKDFVYPDTVSITFVENELGFVRNYIQNWFEMICRPDTQAGNNSYYFLPDQKAAKKNGVIVPLMGIGIPSPAVIKFYGLKPMSMEDITFDHKDGDPMMITVQFSVDNIWWNTPL